MPVISQFYGIIIRMYFNDDEMHNTHHFHARYSGSEASFDFEGNVIIGSFPYKQEKLVAAWAVLHSDELEALWQLMKEEGEFFKIRGLE